MAELIKILIVEDTASDIEAYKDSIRTVNMELKPDFEIQAEYRENKADGLLAIQEMKDQLNGAFIDLKLSTGNAIEINEGNELIESIYGKLRFPVLVLTNTPGAFDKKFSQSYFLQLLTKTDVEYNDVLKNLVTVHRTGITQILGGKGKIEAMLSTVFWTHLSAILPTFVRYKSENPNWDVEKVLLRYISEHILEYLAISIDNNLKPFHKEEFYIKPPVKDKVFTGDIVKDMITGKWGIILTPACDLATDSKRNVPKAKYVTMAYIYDYDTVFEGKGRDEVRKLYSNNFELKYHYLPKTTLFSGGFINFQHLSSIPIEDVSNIEKFKTECVITNPFRKDIISRFSNYFSRQGQPSLD